MIHQYHITEDILISISKIEYCLATINTCSDVNHIFVKKVHAENLVENLLCFNELLNLGLSYNDVKKITVGHDIGKETSRILVNIRQIFEYVQNNISLSPQKFNFQFVQHIIKLLHANILEPWDIGKIRSKHDIPYETIKINTYSTDQNDLTELVADTISLISQNETKHPIIKACIFFAVINKYLPFTGLNYEASLIFFKIILDMYGYSTIYKIPILKCFLLRKDDIAKSVNILHTTENMDITLLLSLLSSGLKTLLDEYKNKIVRTNHITYFLNQLGLQDLNSRQKQLLRILDSKPYIKRSEYMKIFQVSAMTAYRDLNQLVQKNILTTKGKGKGTIYTSYF